MALRVTRHTQVATDVLPKSSLLPVTVRGEAVCAPKMGLRPRTALGDIGNRVTETKKRATARMAVEETVCRKVAGTKRTVDISLGKVGTKKTLRAVAKEEVPLPAPEPKLEPQPEPSQVEPQSPIPMEISGCAPSEDVLCQAFSDVLLDMKDVDMDDGDDPYLCSTYVKDIYKYLRDLEENKPVRPKYLDGREINGNMRAMLIDWLVQVQVKFKFHQETLYMAVGIIDCFLQDNPISKKTLQLVGITAMFIASKYEEVFPPPIGDFAYITDCTCTTSQICQMEKKILQALDFGLGRPVPPHFLRRISKITEADLKQHTLAKYLMELSIVDYDMVHFPPSKTASAASCLALKLLNGCGWTPILQHCTSYTEHDLLPVMQHIAKNVILVNEGATKQTAIKTKYASIKNGKISATEHLKSSTVWNLAQPLINNM
ncbi:G2/mitotic-specific cyclin-B1 isoform X1 [Larus michahellis]